MSDMPLSPEAAAIIEGIKQLEASFAWICIDAVASPSPQQIKAVQTFYPTENLLAVRRMLSDGSAKIGPLDPEMVDDFASAALAETGLTWRARTSAELERGSS
jgi:hypothetical protein